MSTKAKEAEKKTEKKGKRKALKVLGIILCVLMLSIGAATAMNGIFTKINLKKALSFPAVEYTNQLVPTMDEKGYYTFVTDEDLKIVQLTDVHIGGGFLSKGRDLKAMNAVAALLSEEKPDLVIVTGDVAYPVPFQSGTINNKNGARLFAELMEKAGVYWTVCFGNHDTEIYSLFTRDEIGDFYLDEKYEHCLFQKGPEDVDGVGNQIINIKNTEGLITQSLFLFDSHSYTDEDKLGIHWMYDNIHENQIEWYTKSLDELNEANRKAAEEKSIKYNNTTVKSLAFFHIPPTEMLDCWNEYKENGYKDTENVKLVSGFAGGTGKMVYCPAYEDNLIETMLQKGSTQGVFFGHDHRNSMSFDYKGIRLTYAMSIDYLAIPGISKIGRQRGCSVITVSPEGSFEIVPENYYDEKYESLYEKESDIVMQNEPYLTENKGK